jgi:hypothetical protein
LGEDKPEFRSTAFEFHSHPKKMQAKREPVFKNHNERVNVITGEKYDRNHRSYPFEGWTEAGQGRITQNKTVLLDTKVINDPITGRKIRA